MRFRFGKKLAAYCFYLGVMTMLVGAYAYHFPETFVRVPSDRDPALVGDWYVDRGNGFRHYIFKEDGTGEIWSPGREMRKFNWGTESNRLRLKYQTQNGWSAPEYDFETDADSGRISLKPLASGYQMEMQREAPDSAKLQ